MSEVASQATDDLQDIPSPDKWFGLPFLAVKTGAVATFSDTAPPPQLTDLVPPIERRAVGFVDRDLSPRTGETLADDD